MADVSGPVSASGSSSQPHSQPHGISVEEALSQPVEEMPGDASTTMNNTSGAASTNGTTRHDDGKSKAALIEELQSTRQDRDAFEEQYKTLLGKLSLMRSTLGDRLRQDAEELDRRESQIDTLSTQVQDLTETVATLRQELVSSHADNERVTRELDALRKAKTAGGDAPESTHHVAMATTIESLKAQLSTYQSSHADEVALRESLTAQVSQHSAIRTHLESEITHWKDVAQRETDSARNIQSILEEFQSDQEAELDRAVREYRHRLQSTQDELQRAQSRATSAENQYESSRDVISRAQVLEQECKEKNLLIGKLRHEAVILNEHLTEALKRLQRDSADVNVDRRLVSNVLLQFLTTPRQDAKRFEMLRLLGQVLLWNDDEREAAGLERRGGGEGSGRRRGVTTAAATKSAPASVQGDESFSNAFVEFLLSEAAQSAHPASHSSSPQTAPPAAVEHEHQLSKHMRNVSIASSRRGKGKE